MFGRARLRSGLWLPALVLGVFSTAAGRPPDGGPDTLAVRYPCVIFYSASQTEYDSLISARPFWFDSLGTRFASTVRGVSPFLNKSGLETVQSSATQFVFLDGDTLHVARESFADLFGTICFAPGREPFVLRGVASESAVIQAVIRYFGIR
jgi:hypothetical protein